MRRKSRKKHYKLGKVTPRNDVVLSTSSLGEGTVSSKYKKLYHYTDINGLEGILEKNQLWASHFHFLNDIQEIIASRDRIMPIAIEYALREFAWWKEKEDWMKVVEENGGYNTVVEHEVTKVFNIITEVTSRLTPPYIVSFATHATAHELQDGSLDLWRAYSKSNNPGYAIVFNTKSLENRMKDELTSHQYHMLHLVDVDYGSNYLSSTHNFANKMIHMLNGIYETIGLDISGKTIRIEEMYTNIAITITRHKNPHFKSENEVRLVASPPTKESVPSIDISNARSVFHRKSSGCFVPTVGVFGDDISDFDIEEIIIGPGEGQETRAEGLRSFLRSRGRSINIRLSRIPYRAL